MKKPSSSSSLVDVITNHDLLSEILSHVPARSLMRLQLVSKQWLSLITSKTFSLIHRHHHSTTAAMFMQITYILDQPLHFTKHTAYRRLDFNPLENSRLDKSPFRSSAFHHDDDVLILQSCHGLLLCRTGGNINIYNQPMSGHVLYYYVYNPTTNRVATIDGQWHPKTTIYASVLVFDPDESLHYRVVFFVKHNVGGRQLQCLVYSSQPPGTWKSSSGHPFVPPFVRLFHVFMRKYVYFKGCIYWTPESRLKTEILYYNVDEDVFGTLPWPGTLPKYKERRVYIGESASHLHFVVICPGKPATSLDVYELNSHHDSAWFVKYRVDLTRLSRYFSWMNNISNYMHRYAFQVLTLVRREHFGEDSVLVLEIPGPGHQYIVYNLIDETWKVIWQNLPGDPKILFSGNDQNLTGDPKILFANDRVLDFIESLAYV